MLLSDFLDLVPGKQDFIVIVHKVDVTKYCDTISENNIDCTKFHFENLEHILSSDFYRAYNDIYIDYVYAYRDSLCIYIYDL